MNTEIQQVRFAGSPAENCVARQVFTYLQAKAGVTDTEAILDNSTGPWKGVGKFLDLINPIQVLYAEAADQGVSRIRIYSQLALTIPARQRVVQSAWRASAPL